MIKIFLALKFAILQLQYAPQNKEQISGTIREGKSSTDWATIKTFEFSFYNRRTMTSEIFSNQLGVLFNS